jgi:large subunit ribosomal protein L35
MDMPKTRINPGAKKRFKISGSGKIRRKHAYKSHLLTKKDKKRKRNLGYYSTVHKSNKDNVRQLLGMK